jgi:hypothetical protein
MGKGEDLMHLFKASTPLKYFPNGASVDKHININLSTNAF